MGGSESERKGDTVSFRALHLIWGGKSLEADCLVNLHQWPPPRAWGGGHLVSAALPSAVVNAGRRGFRWVVSDLMVSPTVLEGLRGGPCRDSPWSAHAVWTWFFLGRGSLCTPAQHSFWHPQKSQTMMLWSFIEHHHMPSAFPAGLGVLVVMCEAWRTQGPFPRSPGIAKGAGGVASMCLGSRKPSCANPQCRIHSRFRMSLLCKPLCPGGTMF